MFHHPGGEGGGVEMDEPMTVGPHTWPHLIEPLAFRSKRGFAVKALQTALGMHGYLENVRVDGFFGSFTAAAVQDFQANKAANFIEVDGIAGPLTWLHLLGDVCVDMED
jgi:peptidoglycan hydrolase-like protein with peptidoglycan-binding domain